MTKVWVAVVKYSATPLTYSPRGFGAAQQHAGHVLLNVVSQEGCHSGDMDHYLRRIRQATIPALEIGPA